MIGGSPILYQNEEAFAASLKNTKPHGLYLLYGNESYLIASWSKKLSKSFCGELDSFNHQVLDGRKLNCDRLLDAVETLPLMAQEKCVLVEDIDLKAMSASDIEKLYAILGDLPPETILIITAKPDTFDAQSAAGKKLIKTCAEIGSAISLGTRTATGLTAFLRKKAKQYGCVLSPELARYILQICTQNMAALDTELAKICGYAGGGEITKIHIDDVATMKMEARVFDLGKAILAGNPQRAMELLRDLLYLNESPVAIVSALTLSYVDLYRARTAKDHGHSPADVITLLGYKGREFRIQNAWNCRLSAAVLRASLVALLHCDRALKTTSVDDRVLLEQTVIELFVIQGGS